MSDLSSPRPVDYANFTNLSWYSNLEFQDRYKVALLIFGKTIFKLFLNKKPLSTLKSGLNRIRTETNQNCEEDGRSIRKICSQEQLS